MESRASAYDISADIYRHADKLTAPLSEMEYGAHERENRHEDRTAVFVGDYVDREPTTGEVDDIIRSIVDAGYALAVPNTNGFYRLEN